MTGDPTMHVARPGDPASGLGSSVAPELEQPTATDLSGMRVLITNDDGIDAPGLLALATAAVEAGAEVIVVAPFDNRSGAAAAIGPIGGRQPGPDGLLRWAGIDVHVLDAPPAAAVLAASSGDGFGRPPDAVLSGVNHGLNLGRVVLHSGTVGAALTAASMGIPGVAVSLEPSDHDDWDGAARHGTNLLSRLRRAGMPTMALNVNVPAVVRRPWPVAANLSRGGRTRTATTDGIVSFELEVRTDTEAEPGSDAAFVAAGCVTFTALSPLATPPADSWTRLVPIQD